MEINYFESIIRVHEGVDGVVHDHEPSGGGVVGGVRVPRVGQHRDVVVPAESRGVIRSRGYRRERLKISKLTNEER